ncbi:MAG TPA: phenylalanine--tRNA ligase subunit beta, partial [Dehalococcoidia bacterium]|nr:phenylalanine--tRNA ligase subunit beta [Dehalococcoidia bacterium]
MKIPISWIKDYIKFDVPANDIADLLTMAGTEVSNIQKIGTDWDKNKLKVGQILNIEKHPNADRLSLVEVLISNSQKINVVCGANNIEVGQKIAFAESGSELYSPRDKKTIVLKKSNIRGI